MLAHIEHRSLLELLAGEVLRPKYLKTPDDIPPIPLQPEYKQLEPFQLYEGVRSLSLRLLQSLSTIPEVREQITKMHLGLTDEQIVQFEQAERIWRVKASAGMRLNGTPQTAHIFIAVYPPYSEHHCDRPDSEIGIDYDTFDMHFEGSYRYTPAAGHIKWTSSLNDEPILNREDLLGRAEKILAPILALASDQNSG